MDEEEYFKKLQEREVGTEDSYAVPLSDLQPMEELAEILSMGKKTD